MAQAKCKKCEAVYTFDGEEIAPSARCICQSTEFEIIAVA